MQLEIAVGSIRSNGNGQMIALQRHNTSTEPPMSPATKNVQWREDLVQ